MTYPSGMTMTKKWRRSDQEIMPRVTQRRNRRMSTVAKNSPPERSYSHLVTRTINAFDAAQRAVAPAAESIEIAPSLPLNTLRAGAKEMAGLDREIKAGVPL